MSPVQLAKLYARSHLLVLPSTGEALPSVISEALLVGRPVVATDVGAVKEQVGSYGRIVAPGDSSALAAAIGDVLDNYEHFATQSKTASNEANPDTRSTPWSTPTSASTKTSAVTPVSDGFVERWSTPPSSGAAPAIAATPEVIRLLQRNLPWPSCRRPSCGLRGQ